MNTAYLKSTSCVLVALLALSGPAIAQSNSANAEMMRLQQETAHEQAKMQAEMAREQ